MAKGIKYGLLVLPTGSIADDQAAHRVLPAGLSTWIGRLIDLIEEAQVRHWTEWLGSLTWESYKLKSRIVFASMPSERPEVSDHENEKLRKQVALAWYAMLLTAPVRPFYGKARCVTGEAISITAPLRLRSVRNEGPIRGHVARGYYDTRTSFLRVLPWQ